MQKQLSPSQHAAFYHDEFVHTQFAHFEALHVAEHLRDATLVDVGGGQGHFVQALKDRLQARVRVLDSDPVAVAACVARGIEAEVGDALQPRARGDEGVICFNLILHHLIGSGEAETERLQSGALTAWRGAAGALFVNEYIYDSWLGDASGRLIFAITRSRLLSALGAAVAKVMPSLHANTFGVGVRFRSDASWRELFARRGLRVLRHARGREEQVSLPRRLLLIRSCRKDSYLLGFAEGTS
jgi:hypothetical protein